jgi:hypothetical protein
MKNKKVLGSLGAVLILSLLLASLMMILPIQNSEALVAHNCFVIRWEAVRDDEGNVIGARGVVIGGHVVLHAPEGHRDDHEFTCW